MRKIYQRSESEKAYDILEKAKLWRQKISGCQWLGAGRDAQRGSTEDFGWNENTV